MAEPCCGTVCTAEIASALGFFWRSSLRREAPIGPNTHVACRFCLSIPRSRNPQLARPFDSVTPMVLRGLDKLVRRFCASR